MKEEQPGAEKIRDPWRIRTYSGFGNPEQANERIKFLVEQGASPSIAFDLPTQIGVDPDGYGYGVNGEYPRHDEEEMIQTEIGKIGVGIYNAEGMKKLFSGIDLNKSSISFTINAPAIAQASFFFAAAESQGVIQSQIKPSFQNDTFKEHAAGRNTYIFEPSPSLELSADLVEYMIQNVPLGNPINFSGYHFAEAGAKPAQELACAMTSMVLVCDVLAQRGTVHMEDVFERIAFFMNSGSRFVLENAKFRAASRLMRDILKNRYDISSSDEYKFRYAAQTKSVSLRKEEVESNMYRTVFSNLGLTLGADSRALSIQNPAPDEAFRIPGEYGQTLALRGQQVLARETDIAEYGDIFEGSEVVNRLTDQVYEESRTLVDELIRLKDVDSVVDKIKRIIEDEAFSEQMDIEAGRQLIVGVNDGTPLMSQGGNTPLAKALEMDAEISRKHDNSFAAGKNLALNAQKFRENRNRQLQREIKHAMFRISDDIDQRKNIVPSSIALARLGGTQGEWTTAVAQIYPRAGKK